MRTNGTVSQAILSFRFNNPSTITLAFLKEYLEAAPSLSTSRTKGWRSEYFGELLCDPTCGGALAYLMIDVVRGDVLTKTADRKERRRIPYKQGT